MGTSKILGQSIHVFGVRHLSPAGAWHLRQLLDRVRPDVVLVEGLSDANGLIPDLTRRDTVPPVAILAYTEALPVRTLVYPMATYSPEYQALAWARQHRAVAEFIDLPSDIFLALADARAVAATSRSEDPEAVEWEGDESVPLPDASGSVDPPVPPKSPDSIYDQLARAAGEDNYETYWERHFEHNLADSSYQQASMSFGASLRDIEDRQSTRYAESLVREAFMRRRIRELLDAGYDPTKIVAVVGAFHAPELLNLDNAMSDEELARLPRRTSRLTLMPYSYFKLSSQSGYGAGNHAPAYFGLLWESLRRGDLAELAARYLGTIARQLRREGTHRSTAEVIEGVRLARTLSALKSGLAPTLQDLQDAAVTLLGQGERPAIAEALARVEVGTAVGRLPAGVSRTSIQDDFERELQRLRLGKYRGAVRQELRLDLRENRRVKSEDAAYLDLYRSCFLHRLRVIEVGFGALVPTDQRGATWAEHWHLQWTPECEINLVESVLLGETIETATAYRFQSRLTECTTVGDASDVVLSACECGMLEAMDLARRRVQELSVETSDVVSIAHAADRLSSVARYGSVRRFDARPLLPLIADLFVQGALGLHAASGCDNDQARNVVVAMDQLDKVSLEHHACVDERLWLDDLRGLSDADDRNPGLSGYACAILVERNQIANDQLAREVSRRLSPGIPADLGAGWFAGLASRNRYALLARQILWEQLAKYVESLDEDQFRRAIVFLRRALGGFTPQEKRHIAENLGEFWGLASTLAAELLEQPLSEAEQQQLDELNDFDFGV